MHDTVATDALTLPASELARLNARFPARVVPVGDAAVVSVRECGTGPLIVCLHGIGSGAASWLDTALLLAPQARVLAWDAPGYGASTPLAAQVPAAADYAVRLQALLDALEVSSCVLVGHSLGALTAASAARVGSGLASRIHRLVLLSPAMGYGAPSRAQAGARVRADRLAALDALGIAGIAAKSAARLLSGAATARARQWVQWNMAQLHDGGYRQAVELLCSASLLADLPPAMPVRVACGVHDVVTPPASCAEVAQHCKVTLELIPGAGHACHAEKPQAVADVLRQALAT